MPAEYLQEYEVQLPFGAPPVLPDVREQLKEYLICPDRLPIHNYERAQQSWARTPDPASLYHNDLSPLCTTLTVDRDLSTGELVEFREVPLDNIGCTAKNSTSLCRAPGPISEATRGNSTNFPFWPGGFPEPEEDETVDVQNGDLNFDSVEDFLAVPPGFERGFSFKEGETLPTAVPIEEEATDEAASGTVSGEPASASLLSMLQQEAELLGLWKDVTRTKPTQEGRAKLAVAASEMSDSLPEDIFEKDNIPVLKITGTSRNPVLQKRKYAEALDVHEPIRDFKERIPDMARDWEFELDTFQKQAILKLEEHKDVFVAAHTSAGKTVVAEYAIALSQKHKSKAIYTSPIKALSNQKYRDFRDIFKGNVGLITGDVQINGTADCLIMTTEILRSMLYCGSEVVRDIEFVIFDEVHYINDSERGYVWEEVLILLPPNACIVMLSATVPNTMEFADWVGFTKKRTMYVISTLQRPVPLTHYLYTGCGNKTKDEKFLVLDGATDAQKFIYEGWQNAREVLKARESKKKTPYGPKTGKPSLNPKQEVTMWVGLVEHLKKEKKLPIITFILSRKTCDRISQSLTTVDLTTREEKSHIHSHFQKWINRLKEPDRELPQVLTMRKLLKQGIGVHHSGVLPILKEIVEMFFQDGSVKLLFATETFSMGVNMPARTVIFDSIRKFDGLEPRFLLPAEYIQMAGRAGRRGLDDTGTVIIICKGMVPEKETLKNVMLGQATKLESKFNLKYSTILNLLRVPKISVENMMVRSFKEFFHQSHQGRYKQELKDVEKQMENMANTNQATGHRKELEQFYDNASVFLELRNNIWGNLIRMTNCAKSVCPGRILLISHMEHVNKLGILLKIEVVMKEPFYKVLVLCDGENHESAADEDINLSVGTQDDNSKKRKAPKFDNMWYKMMGLANLGGASTYKIFVPNDFSQRRHTVLTIAVTDIVEITQDCSRLNMETVMNDWLQRQNPRFRNVPPGQTFSKALQELMELSLNIAAGTRQLEFVQASGRLPLDLCEHLDHLAVIGKYLHDFRNDNIPNFEQQFIEVFKAKQLEEERNRLTFLQSNRSMSLYPDYESKLEVLKELGYIDADNSVELKGKVACKMSKHELLITELVLHNILTDMQPAEIAALLSCLVYQQRTNSEQPPSFVAPLQEGIKKLCKLVETIMVIEAKHNVVAPPESSDNYSRLNFDLTEVVYEWARGKPFCQIMKLTDVQEGIIVRVIQQLNEILLAVKDAADMIGEKTLKMKMEEASNAIKRDIVFTASLYTESANKVDDS